MALVAHRMMLPARRRRTHQQVARNKVGVLLVPSVAEYCGNEQLQLQPQHLPIAPAATQLQQPSDQQDAESGSGKGFYMNQWSHSGDKNRKKLFVELCGGLKFSCVRVCASIINGTE
ncbi:GL26058 [Drosophila persimilis]|uniref:GL26058 n=1 Tax=Drosophila persimilis TaxID=7234 RepID=B4GKD5_DROPE|nr:GL26058 [Drosophila persimilis]